MPTPLPDTLLQFIILCIPTYQAAEVLLFFAAHPDGQWSPEETVVAIRPVVVTVPAMREYLVLFAKTSLLAETDGEFRYDPSPELEPCVGELARAYNEKPVTLIRAIYRIADSKIQSFADAFKLREDES
jgi:hypothetical protein